MNETFYYVYSLHVWLLKWFVCSWRVEEFGWTPTSEAKLNFGLLLYPIRNFIVIQDKFYTHQQLSDSFLIFFHMASWISICLTPFPAHSCYHNSDLTLYIYIYIMTVHYFMCYTLSVGKSFGNAFCEDVV